MSTVQPTVVVPVKTMLIFVFAKHAIDAKPWNVPIATNTGASSPAHCFAFPLQAW